ncbi:hypothetical protein Sxan_62130 [Streptomyces xanthophaeus]|uniref:Uncharacterized protein n=1 Tax=Streptomyces xanthophaeus TaxID=67385 RepID=A0A919LLR1_9ACTN|nr:hypothetical protein Sxan_62130 [Streptomyces xanthophaeus]
MVKEEKSPIAGSTPAMTEKEMASGISARATTSPPSTSVRSTFGESQAGRRGARGHGGEAGAGTAEGMAERPVVSWGRSEECTGLSPAPGARACRGARPVARVGLAEGPRR